MAQQLPLYYKNSRPVGPGGLSTVKCREINLLAVLLVMFVLVWAGLVTHMPEVSQPEGKFEDAYSRFIGAGEGKRILLGSESPPLPEPGVNNPVVDAPVNPEDVGQDHRTEETDRPERKEPEISHVETEPEEVMVRITNTEPQVTETVAPVDKDAMEKREKVKEVRKSECVCVSKVVCSCSNEEELTFLHSHSP